MKARDSQTELTYQVVKENPRSMITGKTTGVHLVFAPNQRPKIKIVMPPRVAQTRGESVIGNKLVSN